MHWAGYSSSVAALTQVDIPVIEIIKSKTSHPYFLYSYKIHFLSVDSIIDISITPIYPHGYI
jgi:hypothetical protein